MRKITIPTEKEYIVTDQCFWETTPPADYNFSDPKRKPHVISLVEVGTGTIVALQSGSIIKIVRAKEIEDTHDYKKEEDNKKTKKK